MTKQVVLTEREWQMLPIDLAFALVAAFARDGYVLADSGNRKSVDRLQDYLVGVLVTATLAKEGAPPK